MRGLETVMSATTNVRSGEGTGAGTSALLLQAVRGGPGKSFMSREQLAPVLTVLWPAMAAVALMHFVGLYVASGLYMGLYMRWVGRHSWMTVFTLGIGIPVITFLIFEKWFLVPMPKGPLEHWLGY